MNGRNRTTATSSAGRHNVAGERCRVVRAGAGYDGLQGLSYSAGISAESAGARGLCLHTLVIPPGGRVRAHLHAQHESAIYIVSGESDISNLRIADASVMPSPISANTNATVYAIAERAAELIRS